MDLDAFAWLLTDEGQGVLARAVEAAGQDGYDELAVQAELRRTTTAERVAAALTPGRAAPPGGAEVRRPGGADVLHPRRPRAGHQALGGHPPGRPVAGGGHPERDRPGLRHRWRPGRLRRAPVSPRPGSTSTRCGWPSPAPTSRRSSLPARSRRPTRPRSTPRRSTSPSPTLPAAAAAAAPSTSRSGRRRGRSWRGCCAATPASRSRPASPTPWSPHGVEAEWVSDRGEVKEAALWSGRLATVARRATVIGDGGLATFTEEDDPGPRRRGRRGRRLPLRARRGGDPGGVGHRRRCRGRRPAARPARSPTSPPTSRSDTPFAAVLPGRWRSCPTGRSRCAPRCGRAASAR